MEIDPIVAMLAGAISVLWVAYSGSLWMMLQAERKRTDRLDEVTEGALSTTGDILERTAHALTNHERIFQEHQQMLGLLKEIRTEQTHAKDREDWRGQGNPR